MSQRTDEANRRTERQVPMPFFRLACLMPSSCAVRRCCCLRSLYLASVGRSAGERNSERGGAAAGEQSEAR